MHYVAHQTNLAILVLNKMSLVAHIENMLQLLFFFFKQSEEDSKICEPCQYIKNKETKVAQC